MWAVLPMVIVTVAGLIVIVVDCFNNDSKLIPLLSLVGVIVAGAIELVRLDSTGFAFMETMRVGGISSYINIVLLISAGVSIALSIPYLEQIKHNFGEVHGLILFATLGAMVLASANSMVVVFVGLETMSICLYILAGLVRDELGSIESDDVLVRASPSFGGLFLQGSCRTLSHVDPRCLPRRAYDFNWFYGHCIQSRSICFALGDSLAFISDSISRSK